MSIEENTYKIRNLHHLSKMGWTSHFQKQLEPFANDGVIPARVVGVSKNSFRTSDGKNEFLATLAGRLHHDPEGLYPVTGDWVLTTDAVISRALRVPITNRRPSRKRNRSLPPTWTPYVSFAVWTGILICAVSSAT